MSLWQRQLAIMGRRPRPAMLAGWDFRTDGLTDLSGNGQTLVMQGGAALSADLGLVLDGLTGCALCTTAVAGWNFGTGAYSVVARIKSTRTGQAYAMMKYGNGANNLMGLLQATTNQAGGYSRDNAGQVLTKTNAGATINGGTVRQIGFVRAGTTMTVYLDGLAVGSATNALFGAINCSGTTYPICVGALRNTAGGLSNFWLGSIASLYVFPSEVLAAQMLALFADGW